MKIFLLSLLLAPAMFAQGVCGVQPATTQPPLPAGCAGMVQACTCAGGTCSWNWFCTNSQNSVSNGNTGNVLDVFTSPAAQPQQQSLSEVYQQLAQKQLAEAQAAEARARTAAIYASPEFQAALAAEQKRQQELFDKLWSRIADLERNREYPTAIRQTKVALQYFPRDPSLREELKQLKHEAKEQKHRP